MENKELSHCKNCGNNILKGTITCEENRFVCHQSPHQEPVSTQKEELSKCCGARRANVQINDFYQVLELCSKCSKPFIPTQEPMEWESEFENEFRCLVDHLNGESEDWDVDTKIKHFIKSQIKQAEERHNQDCTREEWARASERAKITKEIKKFDLENYDYSTGDIIDLIKKL